MVVSMDAQRLQEALLIYQSNFNQLDQAVSGVEGSLPGIEKTFAQYKEGLLIPGLNQLQDGLKRQIKTCKELFEKFKVSIPAYQQARDQSIIDGVSRRYETIIKSLETLEAKFNLTPNQLQEEDAEAAANLAAERAKRRRVIMCISASVLAAVLVPPLTMLGHS